MRWNAEFGIYFPWCNVTISQLKIVARCLLNCEMRSSRFRFCSVTSCFKIPFGKGVNVCHIGANGLMAVEKPGGMLSHPNSKSDINNSLITAPYCRKSESYSVLTGDKMKQRVWLLNRLDAHTSGVVLITANEKVAEAVRREFKLRQVEKKYLALCFGNPTKLTTSWSDKVDIKTVNNSVFMTASSSSGARVAVTYPRLIRHFTTGIPLCILELCPRTGYTHQLRYQSASRKLPIVGDGVYGNARLNAAFIKTKMKKHSKGNRLFLHSRSIALSYELDGSKYKFDAEAKESTEDFLKLVQI